MLEAAVLLELSDRARTVTLPRSFFRRLLELDVGNSRHRLQAAQLGG